MRGDAVLVSWGRAMWSVSRSDLPAIPGVVVVPALGGLNDEQPWVQTNEIVRQLATRLHGSVLLLHAPAVPSAELRRSLLSDDSVSSALSRWDDAPVALGGIGAWNQAEPLPPSGAGSASPSASARPPQIVAAARSGLINVLVTDIVTASALMARLDGHPPVPDDAQLPAPGDTT
jgi:DNA-binding transcriptional regulator LsrR (DeoR family)